MTAQASPPGAAAAVVPPTAAPAPFTPVPSPAVGSEGRDAVIAIADPARPTHRERLLEGMAAAIREHGFRGTTVADVVRRARTSRRTFYEHFDDREACFLELFDAMDRVLSVKIASALDPADAWDRQVDRAVGAYLDEILSEPELTVACVRELPALGDAGAERQRQEIERFADLIVALVELVATTTPGIQPLPRTTAILLVGGLRELMVYTTHHDVDPGELKRAAADTIKAVVGPR